MTQSTAIVFPGQGSQRLGMLADLAEQYASVKALFAQASDLLDKDFWNLIQQGPETLLNQTQNTQVLMLAADVAIYQLLLEQTGIRPAMMAGHSLGEYPALVCSGALRFADAVLLVHQRASLMQETIPLGLGAMAAVIGLDNDKVDAVCKQASSSTLQVMPANFNAPGQVVIAGHQQAVEQAMALALDQGASLAKLLPVSVPCHCNLLVEAAAAFTEALAATSFQLPSCPVISNVDAKAYDSVDQIRSKLAAQLYQPVRWVETIEAMRSAGINHIIESGPGRVLCGLIKRIDRGIKLSPCGDLESLGNLVNQSIED